MHQNLVPTGDGMYKISAAESIKQRAERMDSMKKALGMPLSNTGKEEYFARDAEGRPILAKRDGDGKPILEKASLTTAGGLVTYDLRDPSLHLIPWLSPLRDKLPRVDKSAKAGTTAHWKSIFASSIVQGAYQADPWINEGARAPLFTFSASDENQPYVTIGQDGSVTFEAQSAAVALEDANATARFFALEGMMTREEDALIGGNNSLKLGTCGTPTLSKAGTAGTLPTANYYVACVALTYGGYRNSSVDGGVATQKTVVTPDGKTMTVNGGSSQKSAISSVIAITLGEILTAVVPAKVGAFAYAWYIGNTNSAAALHLTAITTVPTLVQSTDIETTTQAASAITLDLSVNDGTTGGGSGQVTAFDGFLVQAINAANGSNENAYVQNVAGTLTSSGQGGVDEIDEMLEYMWNTFRVTVDAIYVNAQELKNITRKVLNGSSAPLLRYNNDSRGENYDLVGSGTISFYFNPYMPGGGRKIPIMIHPTLPPGTIFAYASTLPAYFKTNSTPTVAEVLCRRDYYSIDWAQRTREYEFGVYAEECLAVYAPFCLGVLTGIVNG